jgi:sugar phosphate isomerase/epimerase
MQLGPDDLVLCSGTLPRDTSFEERLAAARDAGFAAISLWGRDHAAARLEGLTDSDMRSMLDDHGLEVAELDPAWWWLPGATDVHVPLELDFMDVFRFGEKELFSMGESLGARSVNAVDVFGGDWDLRAAAESFAALCSRAAEHGLLVHLEWLPWSRIPDLATALEIVQIAQAPNGGLNVDAWHFTRSGTDSSELRKVPGELVLAVQLDDGPADAEADLMNATLHERLLPGEGDFDLTGIVAAIRESGSGAPIGVEVFADDLHAAGAHEAARRAAESARSVLREAR